MNKGEHGEKMSS